MTQPTRFGKNDWVSGTATDSDGRPAYVPNVAIVAADPAIINIGSFDISGPLGTQAIAAAVAVTPATSSVFTTSEAAATVTNYSIADMTGASQSAVAAGNGTHLIFLQAPATNSGVVWVSLAGGTAVVGTGMPLAAGAYVTLPGLANAVTAIAATAHDKLTVYAG